MTANVPADAPSKGSNDTMSDVQRYVAMQPKFAWRRQFMRGFMIRWFTFNFLWNVKVTGQENVPDKGSAMIMMSHASLIDPVLCMGAITNRFVVPMTKSENMDNKIIGPLVRWWGSYSVNRGEVDRKALLNSIELAKSGTLILIAPEGTRQEHGLAEPKDGMAYIATKADAAVIPTGITGAETWKEDFKNRRRPNIRVNFGRPFRFKTEGRTRIPREELAIMMREAMYQLALAMPDESKRGVYSDLSQMTTDHLEFIDPKTYR